MNKSIFRVGDSVKVHLWTRWVDGKVVEVIKHSDGIGEVVRVEAEGISDTYQDYKLAEIQNNYKNEVKK